MRSAVTIILIILFSLLACSTSNSVRRQLRESSLRHQSGENRSALNTFTGKASYYGAEFHGRKTSSGETYNMYDLTAAHPDLPFGTICRVTNLRNNKSVTVKINDRGPFVRDRIIDLSYAAAAEIGGIIDGIMQVSVEVIKYGNEESNN